jgi:hypothetical protein
MKQIINVSVKTRRASFPDCRTDLLVVGRFSDAAGPDASRPARRAMAVIGRRRPRLHGQAAKVLLYGKAIGAHARCWSASGAKEGDPRRLQGRRRRRQRAVDLKVKQIALALHSPFVGLHDPAPGRVMAEGVYLGSYRYDEFVTQNGNGRPFGRGRDPTSRLKSPHRVSHRAVIGRSTVTPDLAKWPQVVHPHAGPEALPARAQDGTLHGLR